MTTLHIEKGTKSIRTRSSYRITSTTSLPSPDRPHKSTLFPKLAPSSDNPQSHSSDRLPTKSPIHCERESSKMIRSLPIIPESWIAREKCKVRLTRRNSGRCMSVGGPIRGRRHRCSCFVAYTEGWRLYEPVQVTVPGYTGRPVSLRQDVVVRYSLGCRLSQRYAQWPKCSARFYGYQVGSIWYLVEMLKYNRYVLHDPSRTIRPSPATPLKFGPRVDIHPAVLAVDDDRSTPKNPE